MTESEGIMAIYTVHKWHEDDGLLELSVYTSEQSAREVFEEEKADTSYPESLTLAGPWEDGDVALYECDNCNEVIDSFTPDFPESG
jgi:hypothetical protein